MRRRFNYRFALALALSLTAAGVGVAAFHRRQLAKQVADLPRLADRAEADGKPDRALRFFSMYLARVPSDQTTRLRMVEMLGRRAETPYQIRQVMAEFEKVLQAESTRPGLRLRIGELYFLQKLYKEALAHAEVLEKESSTDDAVVLDLKGRCQAALGDYKAAAESYRRAVASPAAPIETFTRYASALVKLNKPADADAAMELMVARYQKSHDSYLRRAAYRLERGGAGEETAARVKADFTEAIRLAPDNADVLLISAGLAQEAGDPAAARGHLERGIALHPGDTRFYAALAQRHVAEGRKPEALAVLKDCVAKLGENVETSLAVAELFLQLGVPAEARYALRKAGTRVSPVEAVRVRVIEARIAMAEGDWPTAYRGLESVRSQISDKSRRSAEIDLDLVACATNLRQTERRLVYAWRAAAAVKDDPTIQFTLASAQIAADRLFEAEDTLRTLCARKDIADHVLLEYARVLLALQRRGTPTEKRWEDAKNVLNRLTERKDAGPEVAVMQAELLLARGDAGAARGLLTAARDKAPKQVTLWIGLAALEALSGGPGAAGRILKDAGVKAGDSPDLRFARLRFELDPTDPQRARLLDELAVGTEVFPVVPRTNLLLQLADVNARTERPDVARTIVDEVIRLRPNDLGTWLVVCDIAAQLNDRETLAAALTVIKKLEGGAGQLGQYVEGNLLALKAAAGDKAAAEAGRRLVQELIRADPMSPRPYLLAARLDDSEGKEDAATEKLISAVRLGDRRPELLRRAVQKLEKQGRFPDAYALIGTLDPGQMSPFLRRTAAELSLRLNDPNRAADLATKVFAAEKATPDDLHWQAWVYIGAKRPAEAEKVLHEAILRGGGPECRLTLVRVLAGQPGPDASAKAATEVEALEAAAKTPVDKLAAAEGRNLLGDVAKAEKHYRAAVTDAPNEPKMLLAAANHYLRTDRFPFAELYLRRITSKAVPAKPEDLAVARRTLAVGLANGRDWNRCKEALALLDANGKDAPGDPEDAAARAAVFANTPGRRQEAIRWYEQEQAKHLLSPEQYQSLSGAYVTTGEWLKARQPLLQYIGDGTAVPPAALANAIGLYLRFKDVDGAEDFLRRLRFVEPNSVRTQVLAARVALAQGRNTRAVELLSPLKPTADADRLLLAEAWELVKDFPKAEAVLTEYEAAGKEPGRPLTLLHFYARTGKIDNAIALCERQLRTGSPPDAVLAVSLDALRGRTPDPSIYEKVEAAMGAAPGGPARWADYFLAAIREEQGRYPEAVAATERFLVAHPGNRFGLLKRARLALLHGNDPAAALRHAEAGIAAYGPDPAFIDMKAAALAAVGKSDLARTELETSTADSNEPALQFRLARLLLAADRQKDAIERMKLALDGDLTERDLHPIERPLLKATMTALKLRR